MTTLNTGHLNTTLRNGKVDGELAKSYVTAFRIIVTFGQFPCFDIRLLNGVVNASFKLDHKTTAADIEKLLFDAKIKANIKGDFVHTDDLTFYVDRIDKVLLMHARNQKKEVAAMSSLRSTVRKQLETASTESVETAKKHKSTTKMVSKISAIVQAMGMDEGQWDAVSKAVFRKAFGGKREKANVEKASGPKNTNEFCNTLGHDLERLNTKVKTMAKNPRKTDAMFVADELEGMADFARSGIAVFK